MLLRTYADASCDHMWDALIAMADLFRLVAQGIADQCGFEYPHEEDRRVTAHLLHVRSLPHDAPQIY